MFTQIVAAAVDEETSVRASLLTLLEYIIPLTTQDTITPFVKLFVGYITSAMSHMNKAIRRDALSLLSLLYRHYPSLLWPYAVSILPNFCLYVALPIGAGGTSIGLISAAGATVSVTSANSKAVKAASAAAAASVSSATGDSTKHLNAVFKARATQLEVIEQFISLYPFDDSTAAVPAPAAVATATAVTAAPTPSSKVWDYESQTQFVVHRPIAVNAYGYDSCWR